MSTKSDVPDTPPEILARKPLALTQETARLLEKEEYMGGAGEIVRPNESKDRNSAAIVDTMARAEAWAGGEPLRGLTVEQINEIRNREYEGQPKQLPQLGDRTPVFVNWIWAHHPQDAKVRYFPRGVWPTELPKDWPPSANGLTLEKLRHAKALMDANQPKDQFLTIQASPGSILDQYNKGELSEHDAAIVRQRLDQFAKEDLLKIIAAPAKPKRTYTRKAKPSATP